VQLHPRISTPPFFLPVVAEFRYSRPLAHPSAFIALWSGVQVRSEELSGIHEVIASVAELGATQSRAMQRRNEFRA